MNNIPDYDKDPKAFALFAGEVLQPEKNKHDFPEHRDAFNHHVYDYGPCRKCGRKRMPELDTCHIADPIDCEDWKTAKKWQKWAIREYSSTRLRDAMVDCYMAKAGEKHKTNWDFVTKIRYTFYHSVMNGKPADIIEAVVRLVLQEKE